MTAAPTGWRLAGTVDDPADQPDSLDTAEQYLLSYDVNRDVWLLWVRSRPEVAAHPSASG